MYPSHVRTRIMQDHESLRQRLSELEDAVSAMLADETKASRVSELAHQLLLELARHTELEDAILAPALMEIDAWGQIRANQLLTHHQAQRAQIRELTVLYSMRLLPPDTARVTISLVNELRADMEHEERDILHADILRDDVIAVAGESG